MNRLATYILRVHFSHPYFRPFVWSSAGIIISCVLAAALFRATGLRTSPVGWEKSFVVSPAPIAVRHYSCAVKGRFAGIVTEGNRFGDQGIFVQISVDGGNSFSEPTAVSLKTIPQDESAKAPKSPSIAVSPDGVLYVTWQEFDEPSSGFVVYGSISSDFGVTWQPPERLDFGGTDMNFIPHVSYDDGGRLHIFYHAFANGAFNLYHVWRDKGEAFSKPENIARLSPEMKGAFFPSIASSGRYIFVAWQGKGLERDRLTDDIYFIRSTNRGSDFSDPERITRGESSSSAPFLLFSGERLFCVYESNERKNWDIRMIQSGTLGESWDSSPLIVSSTNANCYAPAMTATGNDELVFFWYDNREGVNRVFTRKYGLKDNRFSKEVSLTEGKNPSRNPYGAVVGNRLFVVWEQNSRVYGTFSDVSADIPVVSSKTHPEGKWVKSADAVITWSPPKDESGIAGYASLLSRDPDTNPTVQNLNERTRSETIRSLGEGITYYHLRAIDGAGNYSRTVHFPLRVSRSPLPMPVIESMTHPEGKGVPSDSPRFTWAISDIERVKGFVYAVSPNAPGKPDTFTESMNLSLEGLREGRYFLRVQGIDKTNTPGRVADYEFIVGRAERLDPNEYRRYAMREPTDEGKQEKPLKIRKVYPSIEFMPFAETIGSSKAEFGVKVKSVKGYVFDRLSYELYAGNTLAYKGGSGGERVSLSGLSDGEYRIAVRGVFSQTNGKPYETEPVEIRFRVAVPTGEGPLVILMREIVDIAAEKPVIPVMFFPLVLMMIFIVSSGRLLFYFREFGSRVASRLRLIASSFGQS